MITQAQLNSMSITDLVALNKRVVATVKAMQKLNNTTASFSFMPGDAVNFTSKYGARIDAKVLQVKRTKVLVEIGKGGQYLVPASMLRHGA